MIFTMVRNFKFKIIAVSDWHAGEIAKKTSGNFEVVRLYNPIDDNLKA